MAVRQSGDYDRRMRVLEEKLDRVLDELKSLREQRSGRSERGRLGPTSAPPEFREAYEEFSRRLSELERSREKT